MTITRLLTSSGAAVTSLSASSINAHLLPKNIVELTPAYFLIDTDIPHNLGDWYSLSQRNDENIARMARRHVLCRSISVRCDR